MVKEGMAFVAVPSFIIREEFTLWTGNVTWGREMLKRQVMG